MNASDLSGPLVAPGPITIIREGNGNRITATPASNHPSRGFHVPEVFFN